MKRKLEHPWNTDIYVLKVMWSITFFQFHPWQFNFGLNNSNDRKKKKFCVTGYSLTDIFFLLDIL